MSSDEIEEPGRAPEPAPEATPKATDPAKITRHRGQEIHEIDGRYHTAGVSFATRLEAMRHLEALSRQSGPSVEEDEGPASVTYRGHAILRRYEVGQHSFETRAEAARHIDALIAGNPVSSGRVTSHKGVEILESGGRYHVGEDDFATRLEAIRHINRVKAQPEG